MKKLLVLFLLLGASFAQTKLSSGNLSSGTLNGTPTGGAGTGVGLAWAPTLSLADLRANNTSNCFSGFETCAPQVGTTSNHSTFPGASETRWVISSISRPASSSTVTVTIQYGGCCAGAANSAFQFSTTDNVVISGVSNATAFPNGTYKVTAVNATTITYTQAGVAATSSGGTARRQNPGAEDNYVKAPANVSNIPNDGMDIHDLIYYNATTNTYQHSNAPIIAHVVPFQHCPAGACLFSPKPNITTNGGHVMVGYHGDNASQVAAQIAHMKRVGINVMGMDWDGPPFSGASATRLQEVDEMDLFASQLSGQSAFRYLVEIDQSTWNTGATCSTTSTTQPSCVEKVIDCSLDYANTALGVPFSCVAGAGNGGTPQTMNGGGYFPDAAYFKFNGQPIVGSFLSESSWFSTCSATAPCTYYNNGAGGTCTSSGDCWTKIWTGVAAHTSGYAHQPCFFWRNTFTHGTLNCGSYRWINPTSDPTNHDMAGYDSWISTASTSTKFRVSMGVAHNSHAQSSFQDDKLWMGSNCGELWLDSLSRISSKFSPTKEIDAIQLLTWNDTEQGTTIETGIGSCYSITASVSGGVITYNLHTSDPTNGPLPLNPAVNHTLDHITFYAVRSGGAINGLDAMEIGRITNIPTSGTGTFNVTNLHLQTGTYTLYAKLVPKALIQTSVSTGLAYTAP